MIFLSTPRDAVAERTPLPGADRFIHLSTVFQDNFWLNGDLNSGSSFLVAIDNLDEYAGTIC